MPTTERRGARLRLQIAPSSSLYAPQRTSGLLTLSRVTVKVPSVNLKAKPALAVVMGRTRGMRRARRGRNMFLRVRAVGDRMHAVRVVLRNGLNRRGGRPRRSRSAAALRLVRVRVNRRIRPGRYRFSAVGTSPEGITVKGSRKVHVRRARGHR